MNKDQIIKNTISYVKSILKNEGTGHDWFHIERVWKTTKTIANEEDADLFICELAALLHDVADEKVCGSEEKGINMVREWLQKQEVENSVIQQVLDIITTMSFKGGNNPKVKSLEGKVVQDADRLDAIGAIGIARCFVYSGAKGRPIYNPSIPYRESMTKEEYRNEDSTAINHFYEKLLKLKDLMNTESGIKLAKERHHFMELFLQEFYGEWEGNK